MDLHVLADVVGAELAGPVNAGVTVGGVTLRAAEVRPGDLFAALPGARAHGADFAEQARAAGAVAVLTDPAGRERAAATGLPVLVHPQPRAVLGTAAATVYGDPTQRLRVLGVTGTSGKTTVAHLLEAGLAAAGRTTGLVGTVGVRVAGATLPSAFTTPEAPDLQALFAVMLEEGVTDVAMEVSSHALALGRVAGTRFAVGAFTNLSQDHLDFHADMDDYFAAKASLFAPGRTERAVICVDDEWGVRLAARTPGAIDRLHRRPRRLARRRRRGRRRRHAALHRHDPARPRAGAAAPARPVQRRERARRPRLPGRGRGGAGGGGRGPRPGRRPRPDAADRARAAVPRGRRLRPQARRRRRAARRPAPAGRRAGCWSCSAPAGTATGPSAR